MPIICFICVTKYIGIYYRIKSHKIDAYFGKYELSLPSPSLILST